MLFNLDKRQVVFSSDAHTDSINAVCFLPHSSRIVTCGQDGFLKVIEPDGTEVFAVNVGEPARCVVTDGQFLVVGTQGGALKVYEVVSGAFVVSFKGHSGAVSAIARSHNGKFIVTGGEDQTIRVWTMP